MKSRGNFAAALDAIRAENQRGVTVRDLGARFGVEHTTVSRWLSGTSEPKGSVLRRVLEWAHHGAPEPTEPSPLTARDVRGVRYAAEAMAETLHRLLREARLAEQGDDAEAYRDAVRQSAAQSSGTSQRRAAK